MNIFRLDSCAFKSASYLSDVHLNKMVIESSQMIANCYPKEILETAPKTQKGTVRKYSYYNHPCSIFVRKSLNNYTWVVNNAIKMLSEIEYRFNKRHFCYDFIYWSFENLPDLPKLGLTEFSLAMPDIYKSGSDIDSYRRYYVNEKLFNKAGKPMLVYTKVSPPSWIPFKMRQDASGKSFIDNSIQYTRIDQNASKTIVEPLKVF